MRLTISLLMIFSSSFLCAQTFTNAGAELGVQFSYTNGEYGGGVSFFDADHDGWDDLTFCTNGNGILFYRNNGVTFDPPVTVFSGQGQFKQCIWIDFDNDGDSDLFVTRYFGQWALLENTGDLTNLIDITAESGLGIEVFPQSGGSSWADIDNDGDLDVYIPNYDYVDGSPQNFMFRNNGDGTFTDISIISNTYNGNQPSFQSLFFDYNQNGYQDLFVINDRSPFSNTFYSNQGDGTFADKTTQVGLEQYIFAMNNSITDIDHDGNYELYISNNPTGNSMFSYNPDTDFFTDIINFTGLHVNDHSWSGLFMDVDNDTWEDLYVCVSPFWNQPGQDQFFFNNGDGSFTMDIVSTGLDNDASHSNSSAMGDINNDGFPDFIVVDQAPDISKLFRNNGNTNNYLKVELEGVEVNKDAFGSRIEVWIDGELLIRTTHGGEGYFTQNSSREMFGLGTTQLVDSLTVIWPGGFEETMYEVEANQTLHIIEGEITEQNSLVYGQIYSDQNNLCLADSILLIASIPDIISWNNGSFNDSIYVSTADTLFYTYELDEEVITSDSAFVIGSNTFAIDYSVITPLCGDGYGSIEFTIPVEESLLFYSINGVENEQLDELIEGSYELYVETSNGCSETILAELDVPDEIIAIYEVNQAQCADEITTVDVTVSGGVGTVNYYWIGFDPQDAIPGTFFPYVEDENGCQSSQAIEILEVTGIELNVNSTPALEGSTGTVELAVQGGTGTYTFSWSGPNGFTSNNQNLTDLSPGFYTVIVQDENGCIASDSILVSDTFVASNEIFNGAVYPNPATSTITIETLLDIDRLSLYDLNGKVHLEMFPSKGNQITLLDVQSFERGVYLLTIESNDKVYSQQLILK